MIGKVIMICDYKFTYGDEIIYINVFGAFRDVKSGNKYIVYSFLNKKTLAFYSPEAAAAYSDLEPWFDGLDAYGNVVADFDENKAIAEYGEYWNIGADKNGEPGKVADDALPFNLEEIAKRKNG